MEQHLEPVAAPPDVPPAVIRSAPAPLAGGPLALLRFMARNRMLTPKYLLLLLRLGLRRLRHPGRLRTDGVAFIGPRVVLQIRRGEEPLDELTPREREVLALMAEGRSNHAIAEQLVVTARAVEKHVTSIFGKLGLPPTAEDHRRVLAVLTYLRGV